VIALLWVVMLGMSHSHVKLGIVGRRRRWMMEIVD
jgi:hypothetical protein